MYQPLYRNDHKSRISIPFKNLFMIMGLLPLLGFTSCVFLTMYKDFESANHTHCNVPNIFPSISAAIGNNYPQIYIWQLAIYLHSPARFLTVYLRLKYYESIITENMLPVVYAAVILNAIENCCLVGLTYFTSSLYYSKHEVCFKTFIATSLFYMMLICVLLTKYRRRKTEALLKEQRSLTLKWRCFIVNAVAFACAAYFFLRHNDYCEPYVYSLFSIAEYIVVLSNIAFHMTTIYDFHRRDIVISRRGIMLR